MPQLYWASPFLLKGEIHALVNGEIILKPDAEKEAAILATLD